MNDNDSRFNRRFIPHPLVSLIMVVLWLLLVGTMAPGHIVLATFLAWLLPWLTQRFWRFPVRIKGWIPLARYALVVLWDITLNNVIAARLVLGPVKNLQPAFFKLPFELTDPIAISVLANTITLTPGTVSADVKLGQSYILIHGLHVPDIEAAISMIKKRYEAPLKEIF